MTSSVESDSEIGEFGERYSEPSSDATEQNVTHQQVRNEIILTIGEVDLTLEAIK